MKSKELQTLKDLRSQPLNIDNTVGPFRYLLRLQTKILSHIRSPLLRELVTNKVLPAKPGFPWNPELNLGASRQNERHSLLFQFPGC
jgi:hypothetical protein